MKNLLGKEIKRGDEVIGIVGDSIHSGKVNQLYDTKDVIRISGYELVIPVSDVVHSQDAWDAIAPKLLEARQKAQESKKAVETPKDPQNA